MKIAKLKQGLLALAVVGLIAGAVAYAESGSKNAGSKAKHDHTVEIGEPAPTFTAHDAEGNKYSLEKLTAEGKVVVLEFFNPDCPFVKKHYEKASTMKDLVAQYEDQGVVWLGISSNPEDADWVAKHARQWDIEHPILVDDEGELSALYQARTTPHMYIIDPDGTLVYNGAIDNSRNAAAPDTDHENYVNYVRKALDQLLAEEEITTAETRPYGCSIKARKAM